MTFADALAVSGSPRVHNGFVIPTAGNPAVRLLAQTLRVR